MLATLYLILKCLRDITFRLLSHKGQCYHHQQQTRSVPLDWVFVVPPGTLVAVRTLKMKDHQRHSGPRLCHSEVFKVIITQIVFILILILILITIIVLILITIIVVIVIVAITIVINITIINTTWPKPAYGRQCLLGRIMEVFGGQTDPLEEVMAFDVSQGVQTDSLEKVMNFGVSTDSFE